VVYSQHYGASRLFQRLFNQEGQNWGPGVLQAYIPINYEHKTTSARKSEGLDRQRSVHLGLVTGKMTEGGVEDAIGGVKGLEGKGWIGGEGGN
jgi:hypothetical protein